MIYPEPPPSFHRKDACKLNELIENIMDHVVLRHNNHMHGHCVLACLIEARE